MIGVVGFFCLVFFFGVVLFKGRGGGCVRGVTLHFVYIW